MEIASLLHRIKSLAGYSRFTPIFEGYSSDKKFLIECNGQKFLLRTFNVDEFAKKSDEFSALKMMIEHEVKCSSPIELGIDELSQTAYMVLSYLDGTDAEKAVLRLNAQEQ